MAGLEGGGRAARIGDTSLIHMRCAGIVCRASIESAITTVVYHRLSAYAERVVAGSRQLRLAQPLPHRKDDAPISCVMSG